jgi:hypothetical protein
MDKNRGGNPNLPTGNTVLPLGSDLPTYAELGIEKMPAQRMQDLARVSEDWPPRTPAAAGHAGQHPGAGTRHPGVGCNAHIDQRNRLAAAQIEIECQIGVELAASIPHQGGRKPAKRSNETTVSETLAELGYSKDESHQFQTMKALPRADRPTPPPGAGTHKHRLASSIDRGDTP